MGKSVIQANSNLPSSIRLRRSMRRSSPASTSFVLAALRALHVDSFGAAGRDGHDGGKAVR
jgi:hypothetical protein